jgi:hypothetical protein
MACSGTALLFYVFSFYFAELRVMSVMKGDELGSRVRTSFSRISTYTPYQSSLTATLSVNEVGDPSVCPVTHCRDRQL